MTESFDTGVYVEPEMGNFPLGSEQVALLNDT